MVDFHKLFIIKLMFKKTLFSALLITLASPLLFSSSTSATQQTVTLKPVAGKTGLIKIYDQQSGNLGGATEEGLVSNIGNILQLDGTVATFDPSQSLTQGTEDFAKTSMLFVDMENLSACPQAEVQSIKLNVTWGSDEEPTSSSDFAVLAIFDTEGSTNFLKFEMGEQEEDSVFISPIFGGFEAPEFSQDSNFDGKAPNPLASQSQTISTGLPSVAQLNSDKFAVVVKLGNFVVDDPEQTYTGSLDYVSLDVTYDDTVCGLTLDPSSIAPPKTGSVLAAVIIVTGFTAVAGTSLMSAKRRKSSRSRSERQ